jgi:hypothetical protein
MKRILLSILLLAMACSWELPVAAVGLGPNQGIVQEKHGSKVELVPMSDGTVRVYLSSAKGDPQKAAGEVKMSITAPSFSPTEIILVPSEDGAYLIGTLPNVPQKPATVDLVFPSGTSFSYPEVSLLGGKLSPVAVVAPAGGLAGFVAPHSGTVTKVGDNFVEVVISPKGEVQTYVYALDGVLVPASQVKIPSVQVTHQNKPYKVGLKPHKDGYLVGKIDAKVTIPAQAEVVIAFVEPVYLFDVVYQPSVIIFPVYVIVTPIVIVPVVVIQQHIHYKGKHKKHHK